MRLRVYALVFSFLFFLPLTAQYSTASLFDSGSAELIATPEAIRPKDHKYPTDATVILWRKACIADASKAFPQGPTISYKIDVSMPGVTVTSSPVATDCQLSVAFHFDNNAVSDGMVLLLVTKIDSSPGASKPRESMGRGVFRMVDASAGPTPTTPEVDVMWGVLSSKLCNDNFGRRVARHLICIEVKIGNNSGHALQLAGIGFRRRDGVTAEWPDEPQPNISYQSVRASAQALSFLDPRNLIVNGIAGTGILMAGFTPFFHNTFNKARFATGTNIVASVLPTAIAGIAPDLTIQQLNNLDDQAFRDGKLIPNNTQVRTMIFVEKKLFDGFGGLVYQTFCQQIYAHGGDLSDAENDERERFRTRCEKKKDDPLAMKLGLGKMVLVGDYVDYMQRVVVDAASSQEVTKGPTLVHVTQDKDDDKKFIVTSDTLQSGTIEFLKADKTTVLKTFANVPLRLWQGSLEASDVKDQKELIVRMTPFSGSQVVTTVTLRQPAAAPAAAPAPAVQPATPPATSTTAPPVAVKP